MDLGGPDSGPFGSTATAVSFVFILYWMLQNLINLAQLVLAHRALSRNPRFTRHHRPRAQFSDITMPISLLVPAYNEEATVIESVRSLLALHYPVFEVIVINDGSTDGTLAALQEAFALTPIRRAYEREVPHAPLRGIYGSPDWPNLIVVDKENGGKADALNAGINLSRRPVFCAVDADSMLEADSLMRAVQPFVDEPDSVAAVGGTVRVINGCEVASGRVVEPRVPSSLLPLLQTVEYLRAFLIARLAWSELRALILISGAFGIIRRNVAIAVGGYSRDTVGEDIDIILKIHRYMLESGADYAVRFVPEPVCWTEAPSTLRELGRQRIRWQRGALEAFFNHLPMAFNRRYGRIGFLGFGNLFLMDVLGPLVEVTGYVMFPLLWALGAISWSYFAAFFALTFVFGIFVSVASMILEEVELRSIWPPRDLLLLTGAAILENLGYRQLNQVWRVVGWWRFLTGAREWGEMTRVGFRKA